MTEKLHYDFARDCYYTDSGHIFTGQTVIDAEPVRKELTTNAGQSDKVSQKTTGADAS